MNIDPHNEREWQAQERALQDARRGVASTDPLAARYRPIAQALRQPLPMDLPADFAQQLAAQVTGVDETRFERIVLRVFVSLLALSGVVAALLYGHEWLQAIAAVLPSSSLTLQWAAVLGACLAASWGWEQLRKHLDSTHAATA